MVSQRCKMVVKEELTKLGLNVLQVELGVAEVSEYLSSTQYKQLHLSLLASGLELLDDKRGILVEQIKTTVIEMVHYATEAPRSNSSTFVSKKLGYNYTYLSNIFSEVKGMTLQQYIILHRIERVKELLLYDELNLTEIAYRLHYSSVAHLSNQFKKITGLTPSYFKKMREMRTNNLENL